MDGVIRRAEPQDLLALEKVENDADARLIERFQPKVWWPASSGAERAAVPGFVLVYVENEEITGFVHVVEADGVVHLEQLSVLPSHARQGHGRALVEAAKTEGARLGYREMTLRTYEDVPWNAPFYARLGFHPTEPETVFHRRLVDVEASLGLNRYGRRVQMTASLPTCQPDGLPT